MTNGAAITMLVATATWGTVVASFIASAVSGGDILFYDNDTADQAVGSGDTVQFASGDIDVSIN